MDKVFLEELKEEIEFSSNRSWNNANASKIIRFSSIKNLKDQVLSTKFEFMQKDANGKYDPNNVRVITDEEKMLIIEEMEANNYPLTARMYNFLLKSYINGKLEVLPKEKGRKL